MQCPVQNEADEVTEVLGMKGAARRSAHVGANSQWNFLHFRVAAITVQEKRQTAFMVIERTVQEMNSSKVL